MGLSGLMDETTTSPRPTPTTRDTSRAASIPGRPATDRPADRSPARRRQDHLYRRHDPCPCIRCLIVDDNQRFLRTATDMLESEGIAVVGLASTSAEAI